MPKEIERKFLVSTDAWRAEARSSTKIRQGYLLGGKGKTVRVRVAGPRAFLTIKGPTVGLSRDEFEYAIPLVDAEHMLANLCDRALEKTRYEIPHAGHVWEVDVFEGVNAGLIVAEIELEAEDAKFETPAWAGAEVTGDGKYSNSSLAAKPYSSW